MCGRGAVVPVRPAAVALAAAAVLTGCGGAPATALHVDVCVRADQDRGAASQHVVALVQGGRQVAAGQAFGPADITFNVTVPDLPTAVLLDGRPYGAVGGTGGGADVDPTSTRAPAPTDEQVEAAQHADADHTTTVGMGLPGCGAIGGDAAQEPADGS